MKINFRRANQNDYKSILELFNFVFHKKREIGKFYQKYDEKNGVCIWVGDFDSRIIASYTIVPHLYENSKGESLRCGLVVDVMVHPDFRGKGIFTQLGMVATRESIKSDFDILLGYPFSGTYAKAVLPSHFKVGWNINEKFPLFILPIRPINIIGSKINNKVLKKILSNIIILYVKTLFLKNILINKVKKREDDFRIVEMDDSLEQYSLNNQIQNLNLKKDQFVIKWDKDRIKWRYDQFGENKYFLLLQNDEILLIISEMKIDLLRVWIICNDFMKYKIKKNYNAMFNSLREFAITKNIDGILALPGGKMSKSYLFNGFLPSFETYYQIIYLSQNNSNIKNRLKFFTDFGSFDIA